MKKLSPAVRLTFWSVVIFAALEILLGATVWLTVRRNLYNLVDNRVEAQMDDLKQFLKLQSNDSTLAELQQQVKERYGSEHAGDYLELFLGNGDLVYRAALLQENSAALVPPDQIKRPVAQSRKIAGRPFRFFFQKISVDGRVFIVEMGVLAEDAVETLHQIRLRLILLGTLLWLVAGFLIYSISRRIVAVEGPGPVSPE